VTLHNITYTKTCFVFLFLFLETALFVNQLYFIYFKTSLPAKTDRYKYQLKICLKYKNIRDKKYCSHRDAEKTFLNIHFI